MLISTSLNIVAIWRRKSRQRSLGSVTFLPSGSSSFAASGNLIFKTFHRCVTSWTNMCVLSIPFLPTNFTTVFSLNILTTRCTFGMNYRIIQFCFFENTVVCFFLVDFSQVFPFSNVVLFVWEFWKSKVCLFSVHQLLRIFLNKCAGSNNVNRI